MTSAVRRLTVAPPLYTAGELATLEPLAPVQELMRGIEQKDGMLGCEHRELGAVVMSGVRTVIAGRDDDGVDTVRVLLEALATANRLPRGPVADMQVALDEILSNALRHGFDDGLPHRIEVTLSVDPKMLLAQIEDDCAAFDPLAVAAPDPKRSSKDPSVGGLGLYFVRSLMSEVTYTRVGAHNRLVLKKLIADAAKGR